MAKKKLILDDRKITYSNKTDYDIIEEIPENKVTADDLNEIKTKVNSIVDYFDNQLADLVATKIQIIEYHEEEIYDFKSKAAFGNICIKFDIFPEDYTVFDNGTIFGQGPNEDLIGDGLLKQSDLPNIKFWFSIRFGDIGYTNTPNISRKLPTQFYYAENSPDVTESGPIADSISQWNRFVKVGFDLNGDVTQTQFKSQYREVYKVKFNRDIINKGLLYEIKKTDIYFKDIKGNLLDNPSAKVILNSMISITSQLNEDGLFSIGINFRPVDNQYFSKFLYFADEPIYTSAVLNYNAVTNKEIFTGNYFNNLKIYMTSGTLTPSANSIVYFFYNVRDLLSITSFIEINTIKHLLPASNVDINARIIFQNDAIGVSTNISGKMNYTILYTKINGN